MSKMVRYYKTLKETPLWEEGAIISNCKDSDSDYGYRPVDTIFVKDVDGLDDSWYEGAKAVENQPDWFMRVYPIGKLEKMVFGDKKQAQAAAAVMYKGSIDGKSK